MSKLPPPHMDQLNSAWARQLAQLAREQLGLDVFVETGTMHGANAANAAASWPRVYSIDLNYQYTHRAQQRWGRENLFFLHGNSPQVLRDVVLPEIQRPALFYLDAHCSSPPGPPESHECPLLEELAVLRQHPYWEEHVILIDDARLLVAPPPRPHRAEQWPDLVRVLTAMEAQREIFYVAIMHDILVRCPARIGETFRQYWLNHYPIA